MNLKDVINELKILGNERTKKSYQSNGALEPLYGLTIKSMKPIAKKLKKQEDCQLIAYDLYKTGNYDLMYLAGMIVDPNLMNEEIYNEWLHDAYFYMISDYIVAVCLSEADIGMTLADDWIRSEEDLKISAGYSTYSWMLASRSDDVFDQKHLMDLLYKVEKHIKTTSNRAKYSMAYFVYNIGVSYRPLSDEAIAIAREIGTIITEKPNGKISEYCVYEDIKKQLDKNRLGFKRKYVRC